MICSSPLSGGHGKWQPFPHGPPLIQSLWSERLRNLASGVDVRNHCPAFQYSWPYSIPQFSTRLTKSRGFLFCLFAIWSERFYALPINESKQRLRPSHAGVIKRSLLLRSYSVGSHATETPIRSRSHLSVEPDWACPFRTDDLLIKFILPLGI